MTVRFDSAQRTDFEKVIMKIALLGCGNMGRAIVSGLLAKYGEVAIIAFDKNDKALTALPTKSWCLRPKNGMKRKTSPTPLSSR